MTLPDQPWARAASEVTRALQVDAARGLSSDEAAAGLVRFGPNLLREVKRRSVWLILAAQLRSLLVALLAAALLATAVFGEWVEAGAILVVLLFNTLIGFVTELKAVRSMEALRKLGAAEVTVRRDARVAVIPAADLVPGDIVLVEGGDVVTADLRLLEASRLQADESTLTGESVPAGKSTAPVDPEAPLADRDCMLFKGTVVTRGSGTAVVVATGMDSELGRISRLVEEAEEEITPLEQRLNKLGQGLVWLTLVIAALVAASGLAAGRPPLLVIETAIALAVAAVPEGLPIIATIALARGMHRMAAHNALVKRLSAVETLGATSIVCTDKTGTLTENRMRVGHLGVVDQHDTPRRALEIGALCNNAELRGDGTGVGDPLEVALLAAAAGESIERADLLRAAPEVREVAFDPEVKMMATVHGRGSPYRVAVKGAPEAVIDACTLQPDEQRRWLHESERLAEQGLRVLALAERELDRADDRVYERLEFVGLVGLLDPPRTGMRDTVEACRRAGVRLVMVTGDHPATARNIARATGLIDASHDEVVLGAEIRPAGDLNESQRRRLLQAAIFARVSPAQKLDLITLHQNAGCIVAMTGDGVNDAPALRKADIGVAIGGRGSGAAREAADMVLKDDNLGTITVAIAEGRAIFDNIRNFVVYLLSCNVSEVAVVALASAAGGPLPLLPLQILFLNLVTDVFPALALGVGEGAADVMQRPPRSAREPVLTAGHWRVIGGHGLSMTMSVLAAFALALRYLQLDEPGAVTVSFLTLALTQLWHVFNMRRPNSGLLANEITRNGWVWGALALCVAILLAAVYFPPLAEVLSIRVPDAASWTLILAMSLVPLLIGQCVALLRTSRPAP